MKFATMILAALFLVIANPFSQQEANAGETRLNFNGPLGGFTAKSSGKYVGSKTQLSGSKSKSKSYSKAKKRRAIAARKRAAEKAKQKKLAAKRAAAKRYAAKKAVAKRAKIARAKVRSTSKPTRKDEGEDVAKASPVKASAIAGANELLPEDDETADNGEEKVTETTDAQASSVEKDAPSTKDNAEKADNATKTETVAEADTGSGDCKKYIPSAGLTISVPCAE